LTIYNVTNLNKAVKLSMLSPLDVGYGFDVSTGLLYICNSTGPYVNIWDISNPSKPTPISSITLGSELIAVRVSTNLNTLYIGDMRDGLYVVDITNIKSPKIVG